MLTNLLIKNYALIEQLMVKPHQSLNIITGETGAGKSILLGAIGMLMGKRADTKTLLYHDSKCIIEGAFLIGSYQLHGLFEELDIDYEEETTIRREITPSGKSRAFINDTPVNLDILRQVGRHLVDIHSQHDNLLLSDHLFQLRIVDVCAENQALMKRYTAKYKEYRTVKKKHDQLVEEYNQHKNELDYNKFLYDELAKANLQAGEQDKLEGELKLLESSEDIKLKLNEALGLLGKVEETAIIDQLRTVTNALGQVGDLSDKLGEIHERMNSALIELEDLNNEIEREEEVVDLNEERIEEVKERVSFIYQMQQKHQAVSVEELLEIQHTLEEKVHKVLNFDEEIEALSTQLEVVYTALMKVGEELSETRQKVAPVIEKDLKKLLVELGMPNAVLQIVLNKVTPTVHGIDEISFLFSANKGIPPQEIAKVASGGEFSRLMLAIKYIMASKTSLPTIIFDEIDTGISGEIALKMGNMFKEMAHGHQIIAISHLHQIAAKGNHHYFVYKDHSAERSVSRIRQLDDQERVQEIAQMISGSTPSESAILSAKELLELS
ncbi:DNA repair protein RecN [Microscilla marina]|uniref:DNA repair protein RecN n=1 Tax=Microscilla marina ATCC 23134 TaxID=313606 RepID=A1ZM40_MICM2|nr:DNA repair protein RecN [Microscilla marina]EAY28572.1 DNA repair protein RecN [Microscilla marina ATCC 23134]